MRRSTGYIVVLLYLVGMAGVSVQAGKPLKSPVKWQTNLKAAHKLAKQQNKPMLIVFGAEWCTYCKKLEKEVLAAPKTAKYINDNFIPVHLDADEEERVVEILGVQGLPCSVVLTPQAEQIARIEGYKKSPDYIAVLEEAHGVFADSISPASGSR